MQGVPVPHDTVKVISAQLQAQHAVQTQPFVQLIQEYIASLQHNRELQVRGAQLDKEAEELRDEVASLHARLRQADEAKAAQWRAQAEAARLQVQDLTCELDAARLEGESARAQLETATQELAGLRAQHTQQGAQLEQVTAEAAELRAALAQTSAALEHEQAARIAAASEVQASLEAREEALARAEALQADNLALSRRLVDLKETEIARMNEINKMHEEMLAQATAAKREAEADREAANLIRNKAGLMAAATLQAAAAAVGLGAPQQSAPQPLPASAAPGGSGGGGAIVQRAPSEGGLGGFKTGAFTAPTVLGRMFGRKTGAGAPPASTAPSPPPPPLQSWPSSAPSPPPLPVLHGSGGGGGVEAQAGGSGGGGAEPLAGVPWSPAHPPAAPPDPGTAGLVPVGLAELMGLPPQGPSMQSDAARALPSTPYRSATTHRGGCCALAMQSPGHFLVSCGLDRAVALWDLTVMRSNAGAHQHLHGMAGGVNDVAFTADGSQVLGAGADKSIHLWSVSTGATRHTLTGHAGSVVCVSASSLDVRCAASVAEDRSLRLWDLARGYCVHSVPCGRMPNALAMSRDANTMATGHVDGSLCLWDVRQCWAGASKPLAECKVSSAMIISLSPAASDSLMLVGARDGSIQLWDFRMQATASSLRAPRFTPGTQGSSGRGRSHMSMSPDGRWVAAGSVDGGLYVWDLLHGGSEGGGGGGTPWGSPSKGTGNGGGGASSPTVLAFHGDAVVATAWSADTAILASADKAGVVALWSLCGWAD